MNCLLIDTPQGRYCQSHRTWHEWPTIQNTMRPICHDLQRYSELGVNPPVNEVVRIIGPLARQLFAIESDRIIDAGKIRHICTHDPDGTSDTCPACLEEMTHD